MKKTLLLVLLLAAGCAKQGEPPKAGEKKAEAPWKLSRNADGESVLTLDEATQKRVGLEVAALAATQMSPEIRAVGRVMEPAGVASLVGEFTSARAAVDTSSAELERSKTLAKSENISARALQAAEANASRDWAQFESVRAKLLGALGKELAERDKLAELVKSVTSGASALVRLDLPAGEAQHSQLAGARLIPLGDASMSVEAQFVGATVVEAQSQARGLLFLAEANASALTAGEAVTGFIKLAGEAPAGVVIPRDAVVRKDGAAWVYVQTGAGEFTRKEISTDRAVEGGWFVREGVKAGDKVVIVGAQQLLSEELKGQGGD